MVQSQTRAASITGWDYNNFGQATTPAGKDFKAITAGNYHCLALKTNGTIVPWGADYGNCTTSNDFVAIAVGAINSLALYERNPAVELIYSLADDVMGLNLPGVFVRKLNDAIKMLTDANRKNDKEACNKLYHFIDLVIKNVDIILDAGGDSNALIEAAEAINEMLEAG
ncbi:MAG: hypothetical protein ACYS6K_06970 [Planctomycetota bacterium]